jgi:hypothetical protein
MNETKADELTSNLGAKVNLLVLFSRKKTFSYLQDFENYPQLNWP